jgi:orotate phosphoribosyltransferase
MANSEKRRYKRYPVDLDIRLAGESVKESAKIRSLSLGGCFIKSGVDVSIGESVNLEIESPVGKQLVLGGKTVYSLPPDGIGIKFNRLSRENVMSVVHLIEDAREHA